MVSQLTKFNKKGEVNRVCEGVLGGAPFMQHPPAPGHQGSLVHSDSC